MMKKNPVLLLFLFLLVSVHAQSQEMGGDLGALDGLDVGVEKELVYIDVRTWFEHKINHIDGDPRIHISGLVKGVEGQFPDKSTPIRLYCAAGVRSGRGVEQLRQAGYLDVQNVGGIDDVKKHRFSASKE